MTITKENIQDVFKSKKVGIETMELKGYELIENLFCDNSGLGAEDEPALTQNQLMNKLTALVNEYGKVTTTITDEGQFQVYIGVFKKVGKSKGMRISNNVLKTTMGDVTAIRLYDTNVVVTDFDAGTITLDSGGFRTSTTKRIMNDFINPYYVSQKNFEWFVFDKANGKTIPFVDGMVLSL